MYNPLILSISLSTYRQYGCSGLPGTAEYFVGGMGEGTQQQLLQCDQHSSQVITSITGN